MPVVRQVSRRRLIRLWRESCLRSKNWAAALKRVRAGSCSVRSFWPDWSRIALVGNYNYFGTLSVEAVDAGIILPIIVSGVVCGVLGGVFSKLLLWPMRHRASRSGSGGHAIRFCLPGYAACFGGRDRIRGRRFFLWFRLCRNGAGRSRYGRYPWHAPVTRFLATLVGYYSEFPEESSLLRWRLAPASVRIWPICLAPVATCR